MANDATIIAASLSDEELKNSINALVNVVDSQTQKMAQSFDAAIGKMIAAMGKLNTESDKQRQKNKEVAMSFDQVEQAKQKSFRPSSAEESYYTIIKNMRENVALLAMEIKSMPNASLDKQFVVYEQYEQKIEQARQRIVELRQEMQNLGKDPNSSRLVIKQTMDEINTIQQNIVQLEKEQIQATRQIDAEDKKTLANKQAQYETERKALTELVVGEREKTTFSARQVSSEEKITEEKRKQAQATLDAMNEYRGQAIQRENERREAILRTGLAARETADQVIRLAHEQASMDSNAPITGIKELADAVEKMRRAYFQLSKEERTSAIGVALDADIRRANDAITVIQKLNRSYFRGNQEQGNITNLSSLKELKDSLKELTNRYERLTVAEINAGKGDALIQHFQDTARAAQIMQRTLNTPVNLSAALTGGERTLDEIAYKMQRLRMYRQSIDLTKPNAKDEIKKVDEALVNLQKEADKWMGKSKKIAEMNNILGRSWNYMRNRLAFYLTVGASTQFIKNLIDIRTQYELNERALGILVNSAERGTQIFNELSQMSLVSPYTLIELSSAAKQLVAYDVAAKDVVDTTRRLADMASAVGVPIERLTYALGQIKAYGYLNSRDARMFANAGIPLVKQLADYYTELEGKLVSTADVYDRIKKKAISYNDVMQVVNKMTDEGGKFFDFQAKMAETLKVQIANLKLAWNNMLNDIGANWQGFFSTGFSGLKNLFLAWKAIDQEIWVMIKAFGIFKVAQMAMVKIGLTKTIPMLAGTARQMGAIGNAINSLKGSIKGLIGNWKLLVAALVAYALADIWETTQRNREAIRKLNEEIAKGAEEASNSLEKLLQSEVMIAAKSSALQKKLTPAEAQKAWEILREEIEKSAMYSDRVIARLLNIPDINQRVSESFTIAEDIMEVQQKLSGLTKEIKTSQDSILGGLFGEGLADDLEDYTEYREQIDRNVEFSAQKTRGFWESTGMLAKGVITGISETFGNSINEAENEALDFAKNAANAIERELGEDGVKNVNKLMESVLRVQKAIEDNPKIRGYGKALLESTIDQVFAERFEAYDESTQVTQKFLEQLKKDYGNTFSDISADILDKEQKWNSAQIEAFRKTYEKLSKDIPAYWAGILDKMLQEMNSRDWTVRVMAKFDVNQLNDVRREFQEHFFGEEGVTPAYEENKRRFNKLIQQEDETTLEYEERIKKIRKENNETLQSTSDLMKKNADHSSAVYQNAKKEHDEAVQLEKDIESVSSWGGYNFLDKNTIARNKKAESELQKALKDELSLIDKVRSVYKDLRKEGASMQDALSFATSGYDEAVAEINKVFAKFSLTPLDLSKYAGVSNPRALLEMIQHQLDQLMSSGRAKPTEIKDLQVKIKDLQVDAGKYDLTKITKGLNSELDKIKDEYELAVELDANPELGNMFSNMLGIDTEGFPKTIDEYMHKVQTAFDELANENNYVIPLDVFKASEEDWKNWAETVGMSEEALKDFNAKFLNARELAKGWAREVVGQTKDLEYKLADTAGKIDIESKKLHDLEAQRDNETNAIKRHYLDLAIQDQERAISELKAQALALLPEYDKVFGAAAEHSARVARRLQTDLKNVYDNAVFDAAKKEYTLTGSDGTTVILDEERYTKERNKLNKELQKSADIFERIKVAFSGGEDGEKDFAMGLDLIAQEAQKAAEGIRTIGEIVGYLGGESAEGAVETINDIATSIDGMATAAQGVAQIQSGDLIGGTVNVIKGTWSAISTWFDNSDKKITRQIKESERAVRRLELAYIDLEHAINAAFGTGITGAQALEIENKKLQLAELNRQLQLEESRNKKKRDEDRIIDLKSQVKELEYEIRDSMNNVMNELLGISNVGDAIENMVGVMIDALRNGDDAISAFNNSVDDMIANLIKKWAATNILAPRVAAVLESIQADIDNRVQKAAEEAANLQSRRDERKSLYDLVVKLGYGEEDKTKILAKEIEQLDKELEIAQQKLSDAGTYTIEDLQNHTEQLEELKLYGSTFNDELSALLDSLGLTGSNADKGLSALQAGIQGITEDQAGALEAYWNANTQQQYVHTDLLTQIRDTIIGFDMDIQVGTLSQMLLQLQQSYAVQLAIQNMLAGWSNPSGMAVRVEMI